MLSKLFLLNKYMAMSNLSYPKRVLVLEKFLVEVMLYRELYLRWGQMIEAIIVWLNRDSSQYRVLEMKGYLVHGIYILWFLRIYIKYSYLFG